MLLSPQGFTTLFPYLFVDGAEEYLQFLTLGLGGHETHRTTRETGQIANAQVQFGDTTLMVSEADARFPTAQVSLYLYTDDADALVAQALSHGATLQMAVADMDYGDRQGGITDPKGVIWWISQRLSST